jgi:tRNA pseudouridine38-40 synthase
MHFKLTLSYDGSAYHGWQVQPDRATIQGTLSAAIHHLTGETVLPQGSGRTDAGVHALAQVTSFSLSTNIPPENLLRALNRALPPSIRVLTAERAPTNFHARYSALRKTYEYRIFAAKRVPQVSLLRSGLAESSRTAETICPPFLAPYVWDCPWPLALEPMQRAASHLLGTHDFTSFAASDPDLSNRREKQHSDDIVILSKVKDLLFAPDINALKGTGFSPSVEIDPESGACSPGLQPRVSTEGTTPNTRTLFTSTLTAEDDLLHYRVTGSGFLHHMVRNIVGTLVEIGRGALPPDSVPTILAACDRSAAGPTAPPQGLFLVSVDYPNH